MDINSAKQNQSLTSRIIVALKWNYLGRFISLSLQFAIGIILARLLGPEPFGLVAIALFVQGLGNLLTEDEQDKTLIQTKPILEQDFLTKILNASPNC